MDKKAFIIFERLLENSHIEIFHSVWWHMKGIRRMYIMNLENGKVKRRQEYFH
jgi:hypothetical protein